MNIAQIAKQRREKSKAIADQLTEIGMKVRMNGEVLTTRSLPWALGHGEWVVSVEGKAGGQDCSMMEVLSPTLSEGERLVLELYRAYDTSAAEHIRSGVFESRTALAMLQCYRDCARSMVSTRFAEQLIPQQSEKEVSS